MLQLSIFRATIPGIGVLLSLFALLPSPGRGEESTLTARLGRALGAPALRGARVAALVVGAEDGRVLYQHEPDDLLAPASNLKILTALVALTTLGPEYRFTTRIVADREPNAAGEVERVGVHGSGDPALTSEQWWRLAADLRLKGLRRIRGDLIVDDSAFDRVRWNDAWKSRSSRAYFPAIGALSANYGAFTAEVHPGARPGDAVRVTIDPPVPYLEIVNRAKTGSPRAEERLGVDRETAGNREAVIISGVLPQGSAARTFYRSVADPAAYAGAVFRMQLAANGIDVGGEVRPGSVGALPHELLTFEGEPLGQVVQRLMKYSNNDIAETLVKAIDAQVNGRAGGWPGGLAVIQARLRDLGVSTTGLTLVDGSGLAETNRVSPRALADALRIARRSFAVGPEYIAALPVAGRDGTLRQRGGAAVGAVRAKTGLLAGVTALSGYARASDGGEAVFSVLVNGYRGSDAEAMAAVDAFVAELVSP